MKITNLAVRHIHSLASSISNKVFVVNKGSTRDTSRTNLPLTHPTSRF